MNEGDLPIQLAKMQQQMIAVIKTLEDVKNTVQELTRVDKTLAEMSVHMSNSMSEIKTLWTKHDAMRVYVDNAHEKIDALENKARGGLWAFGIVTTVSQVLLVGVLSWVFINVTENNTVNRLQQQRLDMLEARRQ